MQLTRVGLQLGNDGRADIPDRDRWSRWPLRIYGRLHACVEATIIILISERLFLSAYIDFFVI